MNYTIIIIVIEAIGMYILYSQWSKMRDYLMYTRQYDKFEEWKNNNDKEKKTTSEFAKAKETAKEKGYKWFYYKGKKYNL